MRPETLERLQKILSQAGIASRRASEQLMLEGRVTVNGTTVRELGSKADPAHDDIRVDGRRVKVVQHHRYILLNKPRGYVTTASDERGRETVYALLEEAGLPWVAPVGRLDKASEGLLLMTNDSTWAARITAPESHVEKAYHVQIDRLPDAALLASMKHGVEADGEHLSAREVRELRRGEKNAWLEIVLDEGRNRQIRRLLAAHGVDVLRLMRVAIGPVALGTLAKGRFRSLEAAEIAALAL